MNQQPYFVNLSRGAIANHAKPHHDCHDFLPDDSCTAAYEFPPEDEVDYEDSPTYPDWYFQLHDELSELINGTYQEPKLIHVPIDFNTETEWLINQILKMLELPHAWLKGNFKDSALVLKSSCDDQYLVKCFKAPDAHYLESMWPQQTAGTIWLWISPEGPNRTQFADDQTLSVENDQVRPLQHEEVPRSQIRLVDPTELDQQLSEMADDSKSRQKTANLKSLGNLKQLVIANSSHFENIEQLRMQLPQHQQLLKKLSNRIKIQAAQDLPLHLGQILLSGPAGNGKSWLCEQIANALDLPILSLQLAGSSDIMTLRGSERQWSNSDAGRPVRFMAECSVANPIIMLEEVDKMGAGNNGNPADTLLMLLEPENAKRFMDNFISTPINMSHISYILTANEIDRLSEPLRSRVELHTVAPPSAAEIPNLIQCLYQQRLQQSKLTNYFVDVIAPEHVELLQQGDCSIRALKQRINTSIENGVDEVESPEALRQLSSLLRINPTPRTQPAKRQGIGFI